MQVPKLAGLADATEASHPPCARASGELDGCMGDVEAGGPVADQTTPVRSENTGVPVSPGSKVQPAARHPVCGAPWHPVEDRCAVPRAGPEDWARWNRWRGPSATHGLLMGRAPGTKRALRLAQSHTVVCERCGDLVPLQKARTAARGAGRSVISPADGCYGCGVHSRKSRRAERQSDMALAILGGRRVLLEMPASDAARVELWMLPRSAAERPAGDRDPQG